MRLPWGGWWHDLVGGGSKGSTYVQALQGDPANWDSWDEIKRCNPLTEISKEFRAKLLEERDDARADTRLKARFLSYRLNVPTADESTVLLTVPDFERMAARTVPARRGRPLVGIDLGGGRAWSAAVAVWQTGRIEAMAVAPGIPSIEEQEKRDRVPSGQYQTLVDCGALRIADGLRVQPPSMLVAAIRSEWGAPAKIICDRFRLPELRDCAGDLPVEPRVTRWSAAAEDVRALRKLALDGPLSVSPTSRALIAASLSVALVKNDDQGSCRLVKRGTNNQGRDDVAAALLLVAGAFSRAGVQPVNHPRFRTAVVGMAA